MISTIYCGKIFVDDIFRHTFFADDLGCVGNAARLAQDGEAAASVDAGGAGAAEWCAGGDDFAAGADGAWFD